MKPSMTFALGALLSLGAASAAWAAGETPRVGGEPAIETIVEKRTAPEAVAEFVVTAKRPEKRREARTPPALPLELPRLKLAVDPPSPIRF